MRKDKEKANSALHPAILGQEIIFHITAQGLLALAAHAVPAKQKDHGGSHPIEDEGALSVQRAKQGAGNDKAGKNEKYCRSHTINILKILAIDYCFEKKFN